MKIAFVWIAAFIVLALMVTYWKWLLAAVVLGMVAWSVRLVAAILRHRWQDWRNGVRARQSALSARAQIQNGQYLEGDERGLYGGYRPTQLE